MKQEIIEILGSNEMVKAVTSYNEQKAFNELVNEIIEILQNVVYWETCPDDYKETIKNYLAQLTTAPTDEEVDELYYLTVDAISNECDTMEEAFKFGIKIGRTNESTKS